MLEERRGILDSLGELRSSIRTLRAQLVEINEQKEEAFRGKNDLSSKIVKLISEVKGFKSERNQLTEKVKGQKSVRESLNKQVTEKIKQVRELHKKRKEIEKKLKIKESPSSIKETIDRLEQSIETDAMSFEKEKKVMKQINDLKRRY